MKQERPSMPPLAIRVQVAERQFAALGIRMVGPVPSLGARLKHCLEVLFAGQPSALDHDPALILRPYNPRIKDVAARYTPHAHDPDALVYREKSDHQQKTTGRKPGAERTITTKGSDAHLAAKFRRLEGKNKPKRKIKIPSRKMQSRSSFR